MAQINEILSSFVFKTSSLKTKTYAMSGEARETTTEATKAISFSVTLPYEKIIIFLLVLCASMLIVAVRFLVWIYKKYRRQSEIPQLSNWGSQNSLGSMHAPESHHSLETAFNNLNLK